MDLGVVTKWREGVLNCLPNGHHNDMQGRLGLQSHRLPNSMWYRCGGRVSNLLPNLVSLRWWNGERMDGGIHPILVLDRVEGSYVHVIDCGDSYGNNRGSNGLLEDPRFERTRCGLVRSNRRTWLTKFLGSYLVID